MIGEDDLIEDIMKHVRNLADDTTIKQAIRDALNTAYAMGCEDTEEELSS